MKTKMKTKRKTKTKTKAKTMMKASSKKNTDRDGSGGGRLKKRKKRRIRRMRRRKSRPIHMDNNNMDNTILHYYMKLSTNARHGRPLRLGPSSHRYFRRRLHFFRIGFGSPSPVLCNSMVDVPPE
jgi:hypothetical protein